MPRGTRAAWRFLTVAAVLAVATLVLPAGPWRDLGHAAVAGLGVAAVVVGARRHRPEPVAGWYLIAGGLAVWTVARVADGTATAGGPEPFPSVLDGVFLLGFFLLTVGVVLLTCAGRSRRDAAALIDSLVVTVGITYASWGLVAHSRRGDGDAGVLSESLMVAYPTAAILLLASVVHLVSAGHRTRGVALTLLGGAFGVLVASDVILPVLLGDLSIAPAMIETGGLAGYLLCGAAALHPSMRTIARRRSGPARHAEAVQMLIVAVAVALIPATTAVQLLQGQPVRGWALTAAFTLVIALVLVRMLSMVHRLREQSLRLAILADTDFITGLENRRRFTERLADSLGHPDDGRAPTAEGVLLVAVERLSEINETLGIRAGDELLSAVGARLVDEVGVDGTVARVGGDTFGVLLPGVGFGAQAALRADAIRDRFTEPFALTGLSVAVGAAVGIAVAPGDARTAPELLARADVALVAAREHRERVARYAEEMESGGVLTAQLMTELRGAMADNQVVMHFQPQVDLLTGRVFGVEALVRWQHPEHGMLSPAAFVPAAEHTGLIRPLTQHVLDRSLAQSALWRAAGIDLSVSVNLSVRNLLDPGFVADVRRALERHKVDPSTLELELTETMAMVDPDRSVEVLGALHDLGVLLSVDDYGTGYSSLAYLQQLPVGRLKIDRSFIAGVLDDPASAAIVRSTIELARHLGLTIVAEGVEDDETYLTLRGMRCDAAQGFGLGRPVAPEAIPAMIDQIEGRLPTLLPRRVPAQRRA